MHTTILIVIATLAIDLVIAVVDPRMRQSTRMVS